MTTGKKLKKKIRGAKRRIEEEVGEKVHYTWLLGLYVDAYEIAGVPLTEDQLLQLARDNYQT